MGDEEVDMSGVQVSSTPTPLPSKGSKLHESQECKPCAFFWKPSGCINGVDCREEEPEQSRLSDDESTTEGASHEAVQLNKGEMEGEESRSLSSGLPSIGSLRHSRGQCKPCVWHWTARGCQHGKGCAFCHLCPDGEVKRRKEQKAAILRKQATTQVPKKQRAITELQLQTALLQQQLVIQQQQQQLMHMQMQLGFQQQQHMQLLDHRSSHSRSYD